jgi:hypothetical protein
MAAHIKEVDAIDTAPCLRSLKTVTLLSSVRLVGIIENILFEGTVDRPR